MGGLFCGERISEQSRRYVFDPAAFTEPSLRWTSSNLANSQQLVIEPTLPPVRSTPISGSAAEVLIPARIRRLCLTLDPHLVLG